MNLEKTKKRSKKRTKIVYDPPCGLVSFVEFTGGKCPYSGCKKCGECITNDFDQQCVEILKYSDKFGLA